MKIPESISLTKDGQYCLTCFSGPVRQIEKDNLVFYACEKCGASNERSLVIDSKITWWVDDSRQYWHESVGSIVVNSEKKILCLMRRIFPFAYGLPAGHLDLNEKPEVAARREIEEEIGLHITAPLEHVGDFDITDDKCRRGCDDHKWHLYRHVLSGLGAEIVLNDEASEAHWLSVAEIKNSAKPVSPALKYIVEKYQDKLVS